MMKTCAACDTFCECPVEGICTECWIAHGAELASEGDAAGALWVRALIQEACGFDCARFD